MGEGHDPAPSAYQPYRPEPEDELVLPGAEHGDVPEHVDNTPPGFDDRPPPPIPAGPPEPAAPPTPARIFKEAAAQAPPPVAPAVEALPPVASPWSPPPPEPASPPPASFDRYEPPEQPYDPAEPYDYRYPPPDDEWGRRRSSSGSGMGPLAIGGFVLLGILAIAVGAVMAGVFSGGVAVTSPSPTPSISEAPSPSLEPSVAPSTQPSLAEPTPVGSSGSPAVFPDGFTARTEPCAEEPASQDGCNSSGSTVSGGSVWVWIGFRKGNSEDLLSVTVVNALGQSVGDGSLSLGSIGCSNPCSGWARFRFSGLAVGNYTIEVARNGTLAATATFTVTG